SYSVSANTSGSERTGKITAAGQTATITQPVQCTFALDTHSANFSAAAGSASVNVTAPAGCGWSASRQADWVTITSGGSGSGNGRVTYTVASNSSTAARSSAINVAGDSVVINQAGVEPDCQYALNPNAATVSANSANGSFNVVAGSGCRWTATSQ